MDKKDSKSQRIKNENQKLIEKLNNIYNRFHLEYKISVNNDERIASYFWFTQLKFN